jgi:hypothetical protein
LASILLTSACDTKRTYAEGCGPLPQGWTTPRQGRGLNSFLLDISVQRDGALLFNDTKVTEAALQSYLRHASGIVPRPVTQLKVDPSADCTDVHRLRRLMVKMLDCSYGHCAEGSGKWWFIGDVGGPDINNEPYDPDAR